MSSHDRKLAIPLALLAGFALGSNPQVKLFGLGGATTTATPPNPANAQAVMNGSWAEAVGRMGAESPELRLLRVAELQMFDEPRLQSPSSRASSGRDPDAATSMEDDDDDDEESFSSLGGGVDEDHFMDGLDQPDIPVGRHPEVRKYVRYFAKDEKGRKTFAAWLKRSGAYRPLFTEALSKRRLPKDLEAIAFIESGLWPTAKSHAGAVGLWQMMPQTARAYGLTVNEQYDERLSIWGATDAATEHLEDLFARFESWHLALAAYNLGYQGLERRMREHGTTDFWELSKIEGALPRETRLYVPKVLAVALILNNIDKFGFDSVELAPPLKAGVIEVPRAIPLATLARAAGTSVRRLREYNPELRGEVTPDRGSPLLVRIPSTGVSRAKVMLPKLLGPEHDFRVAVSEDFDWGRDELGEDGKSRLEHTNPQKAAAETESEAEAPAEKKLTKSEQESAPAPLSVRTQPSQKPQLLPNIADAAKAIVPGASSKALMDPAATKALFDGAAGPLMVPSNVASRGVPQLLYRVAEGDTLSAIARSFGHEYAEIARRNGLINPSHVMTGQLLALERPERMEERVMNRIYYRVQQGDTMDSIRQQFGLEPAPLKSRRTAFDPDSLQVGQLMRLERLKATAEADSNG
jgi:membrane-bound lytic murein transglycosylase D